ncbi:MAG TPA: hypothetical protein G4O03_00480 [Dehalococcoidia bacterium]|nr:hypothetical protein [Dehalococcoidia bacterium]
MKNIEVALRRLIGGDNTLSVVWDALTDIWSVDSVPHDLDGFYGDKEIESCRLEETLERTYLEAYEELRDAAAVYKTSPWAGEEDRLVIIVDAMSIREACLLKPFLEAQNYRVESLSFSLSALPSDTASFTRKHFNMGQPTQISARQGIFVSPPGHPVPQFPPQNLRFIWLRYPDRGLHATILSPSEVFGKTSQYILEILRNSGRDAFLLTSDHGYVYADRADHAFELAQSAQTAMRKLFGGARYARGKEASPIVIEKTLSAGDTLLVRGRYIWRQRDKMYFHGGLSFVECLVPVIKAKAK